MSDSFSETIRRPKHRIKHELQLNRREEIHLAKKSGEGNLKISIPFISPRKKHTDTSWSRQKLENAMRLKMKKRQSDKKQSRRGSRGDQDL